MFSEADRASEVWDDGRRISSRTAATVVHYVRSGGGCFLSAACPSCGVVRKAGLLRGHVNICGTVTWLGAGPSPLVGSFSAPKNSQLGSVLDFGTLCCPSSDSHAPDPNSLPPTLRTFPSEPQAGPGEAVGKTGER